MRDILTRYSPHCGAVLRLQGKHGIQTHDNSITINNRGEYNKVNDDDTDIAQLRRVRIYLHQIIDNQSSENLKLSNAAIGDKKGGHGVRDGWWFCSECAREVNADLWGDTCPECAHLRCAYCTVHA